MSRVNRGIRSALGWLETGECWLLTLPPSDQTGVGLPPGCPHVKPPLGQGTVSGIFFAQPPRGLDFVLQLGGNLTKADLGGRSRGKPAVGVQRDAGRREVLKRSLDPGDDLIG